MQLLPAIARQEQFVGAQSVVISRTSKARACRLRELSASYAKRELVRFGYDLKLVPRQLVALIGGARFVAVGTAK